METLAMILSGWICLSFFVAFMWCVSILYFPSIIRWWRTIQRRPTKRWVAGTGTQGKGW